MTKEEFLNEVELIIQNRPEWSRKGQAVFHYIEQKYGVATVAKFSHGKDCYYEDKYIKDFVECCWQLLNERQLAIEVTNILNHKKFQDKLNKLIKEYFNIKLKRGYEEFRDWHWLERQNRICIVYGFWSHFKWSVDEYHISIEDLVKFSKERML